MSQLDAKKLFIMLALMLATPTLCHAQGQQTPFEPVVMETPWGQRVVPTIDTYIEMKIFEQLKPGQKWSEGELIRRKLLADHQTGQLKLRRYPWKILDGIYALGRDDKEQQIYLLDTGKGLLLIDPSYEPWDGDVVEEIRRLGYDISQVKWVLLTHCHIDHSQSCHIWHDRGAKIYVGDGDAHPVESGNTLVAAWILPKDQQNFTPTSVDQHVFDSDVLQFGSITLHAIRTPGHTPGSTCYYLYHRGKHILFSGDVALHNGRHAWMGNSYADWDQYLKDVEKLSNFTLFGKDIRFDLLLPGHGTVDLENGQRSVEQTATIVRNIVARRKSGEKIDWVDPYPWNWLQGVIYEKAK